MAAGVGLALGTAMPVFAQAPVKKPNILVMWGDDIGIHIMGVNGVWKVATP